MNNVTDTTMVLPASCPRNEDTLAFMDKIAKLNKKYRMNMLASKKTEDAEIQRFYVALTAKMLSKLHELSQYELEHWEQEHPSKKTDED